MPVKIIGADVVAREFQKMANISNAEFINTVSQLTLSLLRNNCPVDTGELQNSWREIYKTDTSVALGTDTSQVMKLRAILSGTKYTQPNDFITPIVNTIFDNIELVMLSHLKRSHPYFAHFRGGHISTTSNIVGLTGLKYNKQRGAGRSYLGRITMKGKQLRSTIRRRRPTRVKFTSFFNR